MQHNYSINISTLVSIKLFLKTFFLALSFEIILLIGRFLFPVLCHGAALEVRHEQPTCEIKSKFNPQCHLPHKSGFFTRFLVYEHPAGIWRPPERDRPQEVSSAVEDVQAASAGQGGEAGHEDVAWNGGKTTLGSFNILTGKTPKNQRHKNDTFGG